MSELSKQDLQKVLEMHNVESLNDEDAFLQKQINELQTVVQHLEERIESLEQWQWRNQGD